MTNDIVLEGFDVLEYFLASCDQKSQVKQFPRMSL